MALGAAPYKMHDQGDDRDDQEQVNQAPATWNTSEPRTHATKRTMNRIRNDDENMGISFSGSSG